MTPGKRRIRSCMPQKHPPARTARSSLIESPPGCCPVRLAVPARVLRLRWALGCKMSNSAAEAAGNVCVTPLSVALRATPLAHFVGARTGALPPLLRLEASGGLLDDMRRAEKRLLLERPADQLQAERQAAPVEPGGNRNAGKAGHVHRHR